VNDPRANENLHKETVDLDTKSAKHEAPVCVPEPVFKDLKINSLIRSLGTLDAIFD
jgi:hypothetical protein